MTAVGYCVRRGVGHKFPNGSLICTRCFGLRSMLEASEAADISDAQLELQRADYEALDYWSEGERDAMRGRDE